MARVSWGIPAWPHRLGKQRHLVKAQGLWKLEHQVHVLHRLPRSALRKIVEGGHDNGSARDPIGDDPDEGPIRAAYVPGMGCLTQWQDMDKRLVSIGTVQQCLNVIRRISALTAHID